jgi:hypothetical protein
MGIYLTFQIMGRVYWDVEMGETGTRSQESNIIFRSFDGLELSKFAEDFLETVLLYPLQLV